MAIVPYENIYRGDLQVVKACRSGEVINKAYRNGDLVYYNITESTPIPPTPSAIVLVEHLGNTNNQGKTINNNFYLFDSGLTAITTTDYDFTGIKSICHRWDGVFYRQTPVASFGNISENIGCLDTLVTFEADCSTVAIINYPFGNDRINNVSQTLTSATFYNTDNVIYLGNCFYFNRNIKHIKFGNLAAVAVTAPNVLFNSENTAVTDFEVDALPAMDIDWGFQYCTALTVNSLVNILTALPKTDENSIVIGEINFAKLTSSQVEIATEKGWIIN